MSTISRWVIPCYFTDEKYKTDPIEFDLSDNLQAILSNEVWQRKFSYGYKNSLKNTDPKNISEAKIIIYPRFLSGMVVEDRLQTVIEEICGAIPANLNINNYKEWSYNLGLAIVEVSYKYGLANIPSVEDSSSIMVRGNMDFLAVYYQEVAVCKELAAFFLAALHLVFPTTSVVMSNDQPVNDGFFQTVSSGKMYCTKIMTNTFMHEILVERSKAASIKTTLDAVANIWHLNLWPLKRYLTAVESDRLSMDHLLDLMYALEGLFEKNASADFIKISTVVTLAANRKEAVKLKKLLDLSYRIRNEMAHGNFSYDLFDHVELEGKELLAQDIYWKMKVVVARMIGKAIGKLLSKPDMKNLRFNEDDLLDIMYKKGE
jgi:hypothetical protein